MQKEWTAMHTVEPYFRNAIQSMLSSTNWIRFSQAIMLAQIHYSA